MYQLKLEERIYFNISHQIVIEATSSFTSGSNYEFAFSLDDIVVRNGGCPSAGSCDFENGACTWLNNDLGQVGGTPSDLQWLVGNGLDSAPQNSPAVDHTYGTATGEKKFNCW